MTRPHPRPRTGLRPRIAYLVTHLMGSGHLVRTLALARVAAQAGAEALVISGGRPLAHVDATGVDLRQLPPLMSDGLDYRNLLRADGTPAGPEDYADRRARIAALLRDAAPDALVCELHPFGRRSLAAEFETAVEAAGAAPAWVSIRDVLEPPSRPKRVARTLEALAPFRAVLIHGDAAAIPLEVSWPGPDAGPLPDAGLGRPLRYTGYVCAPPPPAAPDGPGRGEVLVATGGGAIGRALLEMAAHAAARSPLTWRLLVGGADATAEAARLSALGPAMAEPARADYREMMARAAVSVSLAGYNTAVEAALSPTPALLVPMEEGGEREQLIRAEAFSKLPGLASARIGALTPETPAERVDALARAPRIAAPLRADGAAESARIILGDL